MPISNVVELKRVVSQHQSAPLIDVAKAINIKLRLADQNENDARNHRIEAGEMLVSLQTRVETDGQDWWKFAKDHFDRTRKELEKLMTYVSANKIAEEAVAANPEKSDRAIAKSIGVTHPTVAKARKATGNNLPVEKRIGADGKARKMPEPKSRPQAKARTKQPELRKLPKIDMNVIKQAGAFHTELMKYTAEFCASVKAWHAANEIDEESHDCVVQALEMASMRLQQTAQDIDDR